MNIPILVSTNCYYNKYDNLIDSILRAGKKIHYADGVEISELQVEKFNNFTPDNEVRNLLKNAHVSLHLPSKRVLYNSSIVNTLEHACKLYDELNCKYMLFHPDTVPDTDFVLEKVGSRSVCIENLDKKKLGGEDYLNNILYFLEENNSFGIVVDLEHAKDSLYDLTKNSIIRERIQGIHWSCPSNTFNHNSYNVIFKDFNRKIKSVLSFNKEKVVPLIVEIGLITKEELEKNFITPSKYVIRNEINLIRHYLTEYSNPIFSSS